MLLDILNTEANLLSIHFPLLIQIPLSLFQPRQEDLSNFYVLHHPLSLTEFICNNLEHTPPSALEYIYVIKIVQ